MLNTTNKTTLLAALPRLYEQNYRALLQLMPDLHSIQNESQLTLNDMEYLNITISEQCRYTTVIDIGHLLNNALLPDLSMTVRVYHDARMAEVIRYQCHGRFKPSYNYPNEWMYQPLEKRQINLFFDDWLKHCITVSYLQHVQNTQTPS
jgi:hypothetical protein